MWTERFRNRWQASANYTLSRIENDEPSKPIERTTLVPFPVAADIGAEYGLAETDQRHRAVFNGIWRGLGTASRQAACTSTAPATPPTSCGGDRRGMVARRYRAALR